MKNRQRSKQRRKKTGEKSNEKAREPEKRLHSSGRTWKCSGEATCISLDFSVHTSHHLFFTPPTSISMLKEL